MSNMSNAIEYSKYIKPDPSSSPKTVNETLDFVGKVNSQNATEKMSQTEIVAEARALLNESYSLSDFTSLSTSEQAMIEHLADIYLNELEVIEHPNFGSQIDLLSNDAKFFLYYSLEEAGRKDMIRSMGGVSKAVFIAETYDSIENESDKKEFWFGLELLEERRELMDHIAEKKEIGLVDQISAEAKGEGQLSDLEKSELRAPLNKILEDVIGFAGTTALTELKPVFDILRNVKTASQIVDQLTQINDNSENGSITNLFVATLADTMSRNINEYNRLSPEEITELVNSFGI
jgi:hypothetical protein